MENRKFNSYKNLFFKKDADIDTILISNRISYGKRKYNKYNKGFWFSLEVINIFSKCVSIVPLKNKKDIANTDDFQKVLN